ncbi:MAG: ATP-binding protein [Desulfotignum sp.]|nr:ATP-binding protein [Desulfotignum sp.]
MEKITLKPVFVKTKNVRNFDVMMDGLSLANEEGCFGMVFSQAGRGKSRTCQVYVSRNDGVYVRIMRIWKRSELEFLRGLCKAAGVKAIPNRVGATFQAIIDAMVANPRPIFLDEMEKMRPDFIDILRDIADVTGLPIILMGEEELVSYMQRDRRIWSRTFQQLEFGPIEIADIMLYAKESIGLQMSIDVASMVHKSSGGDWRPVKRTIINMAHYMNANPGKKITQGITKMILDSALTGRKQ